MTAVKIKLLSTEKEGVYKKYTANIDAYQLFLKGKFHANSMMPEGVQKSIEYYDDAISLDPNYAIAYAEKAFSYMNLIDIFGFTLEKHKVIQLAHRAIQLDSEDAESNIAIGRIKLHWEWNIPEATKSFRKALDINSNGLGCSQDMIFIK